MIFGNFEILRTIIVPNTTKKYGVMCLYYEFKKLSVTRGESEDSFCCIWLLPVALHATNFTIGFVIVIEKSNYLIFHHRVNYTVNIKNK